MRNRLFFGSLTTLLCSTLFAHSQSNRVINIQMLDSKTGQPITSTEIEVRMRRDPAAPQTLGISPAYVRVDQDGWANATLPTDASEITVFATYGKARWSYISCDGAKDQGSYREHWYSISRIIASGIAAPNGCTKRAVTAQPGEFFIFVRPMNFWEKMKE
jgi:hypothetical protein